MIAEVYVVLTLCIFGFIGNAVTIATTSDAERNETFEAETRD